MKNIINVTTKLFAGLLFSFLITTNGYSQSSGSLTPCLDTIYASNGTDSLIINETGTYSIKNITCHGANDGSITVTITSFSPNPNDTCFFTLLGTVNGKPPLPLEGYSVGSNTYTFTNLKPDNDINIIANVGSAGCGLSALGLRITQPNALTISSSNVTNLTCNGIPAGAISVTASGGTAPYAYSDNGGATYQASNVFTGLAAGSYTITVKDKNNCTVAQTFTVTQPNVVALSISPNTAICVGQSATLTASGNGTFTWSTGSSSASISVSPASTTTYTVTIDSATCTNSANVKVTVNPIPATPTITAGGVTTFCSGSSVTLTGSTSTSGVTYQWYNSGTAIAGATNAAYSATISGSYTVSVTATGCSATSTATVVTVNTTPVTPTIIAGGPTTFCNGGSVILTGTSTTSGVTYQWYNAGTAIAGATNTTYAAAVSGSYTITATLGTCSSTSTATSVTVNPIPTTPTISASGPTTFCSGSSVTLNTTVVAGYSYQWDNGGVAIAGATNAAYTATTSGTYTVVVSSLGCSSSSSTAITVIATPATPTITAGGPTTFCAGGSVTLTGSSTTSGVTYQWNQGGVAIGGATNATYSATTSGSYTVTALTGVCSATSTATIVTVNPIPSTPTISVGGPTTFCTGGNVTLTGSSSTSGVTYQWYNNGTAIAGATNATYNATTSANYTVTVTKTGCSATSSPTTVTVNVIPNTPTISAGGLTTFCSGGSVNLTGNSTTAGVTYQWLDNGTAIAGATNATYSATTSGNYTISATLSGCSATSTATTVTVNTTPVTPTIAAAGPTSFCTGASVTLTGSTSTASVTYQWYNNGTTIAGATNAAYNATTSANYTVTVTKTGCSATSTATTVTVNIIPNTPTIFAGGVTTFCSGGSVNLTGNSTTPGVAYQWFDNGTAIAGATNATYSATTSGNYTISATLSGCSATSTATTVTVNTTPVTPTIAAAGPTSFCTGASVILTGSTSTASVTYQWYNNGTTIAGATNAAYNATTSANYTVTVLKTGCSATSGATTVTVNPIPTTPTITPSGPTTFCSGSSVTLNTTVVAGYSYQWDNGGVAIAGATNAAYTATTSGTYTVVVSSLGCSSSSSTAITVIATPATPTITAGAPTTFCAGSSVTLTGSSTTSGVTYQWSEGGVAIGGATNASYLATISGSYTVTAATGVCSATSSATTVTVNPIPTTPTITAGGPTTFCTGGNVTLTGSSATPGVTYQWYNGGTAIVGATNAAYTATASGSFTVSATALGCSATSTTTTVTDIVVTATITAAGSTTFCNGGSVVLTANAGAGLTYQWYNGVTAIAGATAISYTAVTSGNYTVMVSNGGCSATSTITTVTVNSIPSTPTIVAGGATSFCSGSSVNLTGNSSTPGVTYQWFDNGTIIAGATNANYNATTSSNYTVSATATGCSATSTPTTVTANITPSTPIINTGGPTSFCTGGSVTLTGSTTTAGVTYQWYNNGSVIAGATNVAYDVTISGSYTLTVTLGNCSATSTPTSVTVNPIPLTPTIVAGSATTFCSGNNVILTGSSSTPGVAYQWYNNGTAIAGATNAAYTDTTSGSFTVSASASGCSATSTPTTVTVNTTPVIPTIATSGATTFCSGNTITLTGNSSTSGVAYQWYNNGTAISGATNATYIDSLTGSYTVTAFANGCSSTSLPTSITVNTTPATPIINAGGPTTFCSGNAVTLTGNSLTAGVAYQWYNNGTVIPGANSASYTDSVSGNYTVSATINGCSALSTPITITDNIVTATITTTSPTTFCTGDSVVLTANAGAGLTYQWNNGGIAIAGATTISYTALTSGNYTIIVSNGACSVTSSATLVTVNIIPNTPTIAAGGATTFCSGSSVLLTGNSSTPGVTYQWYINGTVIAGANSASYTDSTSGNITVSATANGCSSTSVPTSVTVNTTPNTPTIAASGTTTLCSGDSVILTGSSSTPGVTYQWYNNGTAIAGANSTAYTDSSSGNYTVSVTANGCSATSTPTSVTANITPNTPIINAGGPTTFCSGSAVTLTGSSSTIGVTYQWYNNGTAIAGANSASYTDSSSGNITVSATANGCSSTSTPVTITDNVVTATITTTSPTTFCSGDSVILSANAGLGLTYQWLNSGTSIAGATTISYTSKTSGNYTVMVSNGGCSATSLATTILVNSLPSVNIVPSFINICSGTSTTLNTVPTGNGPFTYNWSPSATLDSSTAADPLASPTDTTIYTVTITDSNGCQNTNSSTIKVIPAPTGTVTANDTTVCQGVPVTITAKFNPGFTPGASAYSFDGGITFQTSSSFTINPVNGNTNILVVLQDNIGCKSSIMTDTINAEAVKGTAKVTPVSCFNQNNGSVTVTIQGGNSGFKFSVDSGSSQISNVFNTLNAGTHTIIATDTTRGCTFDTTVTLSQPTGIQITSIQIVEVSPCSGSNDGGITLAATGGTPGYQYTVNNGTTWQSSPAFTALAAGAYIVGVKDTLGCIVTADTSITAPNGVNIANIKILSQTNNICAGKTNGAITLDTTTINGGVKPYTYTLNGTTLNYPSFSNLASVPDTIYIKDATGCPYLYTFSILSPAPIQFSASTTPATCTNSDGSITISNVTGGTSPYLYKIDSITSYGTNPVFIGLPLGNYQVTVQDSNLCSAGQPVTIGPKPGPVPYITVKNTSCYKYKKDGIITIDSLQGGTAPFTYTLNGIDTSSNVFPGLQAGSFILSITDSSTCTYNVVTYYQWDTTKKAYDTLNGSINVGEPAPISPTVSTQNTSKLSSIGMIEITGITGGTPGYQIIFNNDTVPYTAPDTIKGLGKGMYKIYITDAHGCIDTLTVDVSSGFFIPNVFTPNGDGKNDYFEVVSIPLNSELRVFDRWGGRLYENTNYDNSWNGDDLPDGVYYYELTVPGKEDPYKGWINIVR